MTGIDPSTSPPPAPRWFGPRASPDAPAVAALIARVARGAGWADIGGGFNLNVTTGIDRLAAVGAERIKICFEPANAASRGLYLDVGFVPDRHTVVFARRTGRPGR